MVWRVTSWEKYQALSPEQREEYMFRFGKVEVDMPVSLYICAQWLLIITVFLFSWYFYWTVQKEEAVQIGLAMTNFVRVTGWVVVSEIFIWIVQKIYFGVSEYRWYKKATRS